MAQLIAAIVSAVWGFLLIGCALWLSKRGSSGTGGALACLAFSVGYFWFCWSIYHDSGGRDRRRRATHTREPNAKACKQEHEWR
jgi:hypothetical protein